MWLDQHRTIDGTHAPRQSLCFLQIFFSSRRRHTRDWLDWSSDVCSSDLINLKPNWLAAYMNKISSLISKYGNTKEAHTLIDSITLDTPEKIREVQILLDIYDKKYDQALTKAKE